MIGGRGTSSVLAAALLLGGCAAPPLLPLPPRPAPRPLEERAALFEAALERFLAPEGLLLYRIYEPLGGEPPAPYGRLADQAIWGGCLLAAECLRFRATGEAAAEARALDVLRGLRLLHDITGRRGHFARCAGPRGAVEEPGDGRWREGAVQGYLWRGDTSKDQMAGYVLGLGTALTCLPEGDGRETARALVLAVAERFRADGYTLRGPDGEMTTFGDLTWRHAGFIPNGVNALIALALGRAAALAGDGTLEAELLRAGAAEASFLVTFRFFGLTNHNNDNMAFLSWALLLDPERGLEGDARAAVERGLLRTWRYVHRERNALWNAIYARCAPPGRGDVAAALRDAREALRDFPEVKRPIAIDLRGHEEALGLGRSFFENRKDVPRAARATPLYCRGRSAFAWKECPYALVQDDEPRENAPADFLLAYWYARAAGLPGFGAGR